MKKIFFVACFCFSVTTIIAQETPDAIIAHKIANKMADSLGLNNLLRAKLFTVNMGISNAKKAARKKSTDRAVIGKELQWIENTRDGLYKTILTQEQFSLYLKKKQKLVNNNN